MAWSHTSSFHIIGNMLRAPVPLAPESWFPSSVQSRAGEAASGAASREQVKKPSTLYYSSPGWSGAGGTLGLPLNPGSAGDNGGSGSPFLHPEANPAGEGEGIDGVCAGGERLPRVGGGGNCTCFGDSKCHQQLLSWHDLSVGTAGL